MAIQIQLDLAATLMASKLNNTRICVTSPQRCEAGVGTCVQTDRVSGSCLWVEWCFVRNAVIKKIRTIIQYKVVQF